MLARGSGTVLRRMQNDRRLEVIDSYWSHREVLQGIPPPCEPASPEDLPAVPDALKTGSSLPSWNGRFGRARRVHRCTSPAKGGEPSIEGQHRDPAQRRQILTATITGLAHGPRRTQARHRRPLGHRTADPSWRPSPPLPRRSWAAAGLDSVPVNTFSYYDQLDTAVLLGALPPRVSPEPRRRPGPHTRRVAPLETDEAPDTTSPGTETLSTTTAAPRHFAN